MLRGGPSTRPVKLLLVGRVVFDVLYKLLSRRGIVCPFLFSLDCSWSTLFANKGKSGVLKILKQEAILLRVGSSTHKGVISLSWLYFLHASHSKSNLLFPHTTVLCG
jgi:hypothetical protein